MAINFPNSPSLNETYSENDTSWKWDGTSWNRLTGLVGTESSTLSGVGATQFARRDVNNVITGITTLSTSGVGNTTLNVEGDSRFGSNVSVVGVSTFTGNIDANADLDVDGHTNLDNVNVAGVSTFAGNVEVGLGATVGIGSTAYVHSVAFRGAGQANSVNNASITNASSGLAFIGSGVQNGVWTNQGLKIAGNGASTNTGPGSNVHLHVTSSQSTKVLIQGAATANLEFTSSGGGTNNIIESNKPVSIYNSSDSETYAQLGATSGSTFYQSVGLRASYPSGTRTIVMEPISGIITATNFSGNITGGGNINAGIITGTSANFTGDVTVGGVLTYEDVKNVDAIGIITARNAIVISEDNALHFRGTATDDLDAILRASAGGGQLLINSRNDTILNIDSNDDSTDAHFAVAHGAATGSSTELFRVQENGQITQTAASGDTILTLKRSNTNTTGLTGGINFAALDGHSVASIQARGDGDNEGAHLQFYTTSAAAGDIFNAANIERLRITSAGKVGINSTSPTYALEVDGGTQNTVIALRSSDAKAAISFLDSTSGGYGRATIGGEGDQVYITSGNGTERIRFGTGGSNNSIGISTTNNMVTNSEVLAVRGTSSFKSHTQARPALYLGNEGSVTDTANQLILFNQGGANRGGIGYVPNTGELRFNNQYFITFTTGVSTLGGTERIRIKSDGMVGINQGSSYNPLTSLDVRHHNGTAGNASGPSTVVTICAGRNSVRGLEIKTGRPTTGNQNDAAVYYNAKDTDSSSYHAQHVWQLGGGNAMVLGYTGLYHLGIGENYPAHPLHIKVTNTTVFENDGVGVSQNQIRINNAGASGVAGIRFDAEPSSGSAGYASIRTIAPASGSADLIFSTRNSSTFGERLRITSAGHLKLPDDAQIKFGGSQTGSGNMYMAFDGSNAAIELQTGNFSIIAYDNNKDVKILSDNGSGGIANYFVADGSTGEALLHHYGSQKFATSTTGITVTGEVAASQDYPTIRPTLDLNFAAVKKLDPRITYRRTGPASYTDEFGKVVLVGDNTPRFDHDPTTRECKGFLLEESRTNKVNYSQTLETGWTANNAATRGTRVTDASLPDGSVGSLWEVIETTSNSMHLVYQQMTGSDSPNNTACTISAFAKPGLNRYHFVLTEGNTLSATACFNVQTGTVVSTTGTGSPTATISGPYGDGWYRCSMTYTTASTQNYINIQFGVGNNSGSVSYAGDGSSSIAVWGVQHEVGGFLTSFIPTDGAAVTRGKDLAEIDGEEFTEFFNQDEGTINCAYWLGNDNIGLRVFQINDSNNSVIDIVAGSGSGAGGYGYVNTGGVAQANGGQSSTNASRLNTLHVTTLAYKENDVAGINIKTGVLTNDTSATLDGAYNRVTFYQGANGADQLNGHLQRVQYYPKRLPDNQLKNLNNQ